jgi:glycosyltransferase involved in cell wall biosynthesis
VLLYNFFPEYILMAMVLRFKGNPAVLDIEDGPTSLRNWRERVTRLSYSIMRRLSAKRYVVASHSLAHELGLGDCLAVYGAATAPPLASTPRFSGSSVKFLYGGAIMPATGALLFQDALKRIPRQYLAIMQFHVSGHYDQNDFLAFQSQMSGRGLNLSLHGPLSATQYDELLGQCDCGLALKLPDHEMGRTTFPSKVIEMASAGALVCATRVSDVPIVLSTKQAVLLDEATPESLADAFVTIVRDREGSRERADHGLRHVQQTFASEAVGRRLGGYLRAQD